MNKSAVKAIRTAADLNGVKERDVFDNIVVMLLTHTLMNSEGYFHLYLKPKFEPSILDFAGGVQKLEGYQEAMNEVLASLNGAAAFEDVVTDYYGKMLGRERGQHMTPPELVARMMGLLGDKASANRVAEPTCGTGSIAMGYLRACYDKEGAAGLKATELLLNDIDLRLLRIAILQVMFHTIRHEAPVASIRAFRADLIKEYNAPGTMVMECTSHRHAISSLFGGAKR